VSTIVDRMDIDAGLPANVSAEKTILGAIMNDNAAYYEVAGQLEPDDFSLDSHKRIFLRMSEQMSEQRAVDIVTLSNELARAKEIESVGGVAYLASLTEGLPMRPIIDQYIRIVRDKNMLRRLMLICSDGLARAADQGEASETLIADIDRELLEIARSSGAEPSLVNQTDAAFQELADQRTRKREPAVSTGLKNLDRIIGGYKRKRLYVVGGRPSMGKTSLMIQAAIQHCLQGVRTRLVSLEMTSEELLQRIFAALSGISFERLVEPECLSEGEWQNLQYIRALVAEWPLEIDDRGGQTIDFALSGCRLSCRRRKTGFVAVDYVQNLRFTGPGKLRYQEISDAAKRLREFAKTENIPVLLLSSITEAQDKNPNKRPTLADLRGSGDLAFHADVSALIHRERGEDGASIDRRSEIVVAKQRGGRTGVAYSAYNTSTLLFEDAS
jgi:replicative DNA helicase